MPSLRFPLDHRASNSSRVAVRTSLRLDAMFAPGTYGRKTLHSWEKRHLFEQVALPHLDALYSAALRLTRNSDDAKDLLQDTVLRAYRFFDQFKQGTNCRAWLLTVLYNSFRNNYRRCAREQVASSPDLFDHQAETRSLTDDRLARNPED